MVHRVMLAFRGLVIVVLRWGSTYTSNDQALNRHPRYFKLRNVIEYLSWSTGGMLCSHSVRDSPRNRYTERGSAVRDTRSQAVPFFRRRRKVHGASSEIPTTSPKTALSLCHPMPAPAEYSVTRTICRSVAVSSAKSAAFCLTSRRKAGMSSDLCSR